MKRTWNGALAVIASLTLGMGVDSCLAGGRGLHISTGGGGPRQVMQAGNTGGNNGSRVVKQLPHFSGVGSAVVGGGSGNSQVKKGNGTGLGIGKFSPGIHNIPNLNVGGNKSLKPIQIPDLGLGKGKPPFIPIKPLPHPIVGPIKPLPYPIGGPGKGPIYGNGPICGNGPIWGPGCGKYPWWGGWCYNPCTPIVIPIGGCYGPTLVSETIVVEVPGEPTVVIAEKPALKVEEKLMQVPVGAKLTLQGKELGDKPGQVVLQFEQFALPAMVNEWKPDHVTATLPLMGLTAPMKGQIFVMKEDGQVVNQLAVEIIPAPVKE